MPWRRSASVGVLAAVALAAACKGKSPPLVVADAFVDAYFRQIDQEKARAFTALGATTMLDAEIRSVAAIRNGGYLPSEASAELSVRRGDPVAREQRVRVPYEITVRVDGAETTRDADIELAQIQGVWKVVRVGLTQR